MIITTPPARPTVRDLKLYVPSTAKNLRLDQSATRCAFILPDFPFLPYSLLAYLPYNLRVAFISRLVERISLVGNVPVSL